MLAVRRSFRYVRALAFASIFVVLIPSETALVDPARAGLDTDTAHQRLPLSSRVTVPYGIGLLPSGKPPRGRMGYTLERMLRAEQGFLPTLEAWTYGWPYRQPIPIAIRAQAGQGPDVERLMGGRGIKVLGRTGDVMEADIQVRDLAWLSQESQIFQIDRSSRGIYWP